MRKITEKLSNRFYASSHDLIMVLLAWCGAYWIRFNLQIIPEHYVIQALSAAPIVLLIQGISFWWCGLYRGVWRFASLPDLVRIVKALVSGVIISVAVLFVLFDVPRIPRSIPLLYILLLMPFVAGPRLIYRFIKDFYYNYRPGKRVLIVGAGRAGETLVRDLLRDPEQAFQPIVFVDDDAQKWNREIQGIRVANGCLEIPDVARQYAIDLIFLAIPSASTKQIRRIVEIAETTNCPVHTLPKLTDLISGRARTTELRELSIEDLLGRDPVSLDWKAIRSGLTSKTILITGAGGSIGSELCRQIASLKPSSLVLLEQSEYNLYCIQGQLSRLFPDLVLHICLGDITDMRLVENIFQTHKPQVVFHAAAFKQVPMLEFQVREAVRNNVMGTGVMAQVADRFSVEEFVLISTDKAVNPSNVMGATKRAAEILCQSYNTRSKTRFVTVRFGNVLGSAGSVVPLFKSQIESGGPVTVTDPNIMRYFMTIPEACQLIMESAVMGEGGEIFVLDMGDPIKIDYLARQMIQLVGKTPGEDIEIEYTGLRPGEKMYEELFHDKESLLSTDHEKIMLARSRLLVSDELNTLFDQLRDAVDEIDEVAIQQVLIRLVPEFTPDSSYQESAQVIQLSSTLKN